MRNIEALIALLDERGVEPFQWGRQDCVTFAAAAVKAQTGIDLLARVTWSWATEREALRILARVGGVAAAADLVLPRIAPAMAHRGDIGLVEVEGQACLVVIEGDLVIGPGLKGLTRLPRTDLVAAWSLEGLE